MIIRAVALGTTCAFATADDMTLPRQVLPGQFFMLTRRCTQRQFLLRPDDEANNAFTYCVAEAANRFEMEIVLPQQMSNHHHTIGFDRHGRLVEFMEHFHKMLAKSVNALRGRWENMWSAESPCVVELVDLSDVIDKIVYVATNPVLGDLVERVHQWPGAKCVPAMLSQRTLTAHRPRFFFAEDGCMPETVELKLMIPPELGSASEILPMIAERIDAVELERMHVRAETGKRVIGRRGILRQSWRDSPTSREPRRNLRPRVAARSKWSRIEALRRNRDFQDAYRSARKAWLAGLTVTFPAGTYWLARFAGVSVEPFAN